MEHLNIFKRMAQVLLFFALIALLPTVAFANNEFARSPLAFEIPEPDYTLKIKDQYVAKLRELDKQKGCALGPDAELVEEINENSEEITLVTKSVNTGPDMLDWKGFALYDLANSIAQVIACHVASEDLGLEGSQTSTIFNPALNQSECKIKAELPN